MTDVENPPDNTPDSEATATPNSSSGPGRSSFSTKKKVALALVTLAVIACLSIGIVFGVKNGNDSSNANKNADAVSQSEGTVDGEEDPSATANEDGKTFYPGDVVPPVSISGEEDVAAPQEQDTHNAQDTQETISSNNEVQGNNSNQDSPFQQGQGPFSNQNQGMGSSSQSTDSSFASGESLPANEVTQNMPPVTIPHVVLEPINEGSTTFYRSEGPLLAKVKMIDQSVVNGYETCSDLEKDIADALKHFVNQFIMEQSVTQEMYSSCNASNPNWYWEYYNNLYNTSYYGYGYYYGPHPDIYHYEEGDWEYNHEGDGGYGDYSNEDELQEEEQDEELFASVNVNVDELEGEDVQELDNDLDVPNSNGKNEKLEEEKELEETMVDQEQQNQEASYPFPQTQNSNGSSQQFKKKRNGHSNPRHRAKRSRGPPPFKRNGQPGATTTQAHRSEDSFHSSNQVDGVDYADVVKSDGKHVFAAYGDVIYAWDTSDATAGVSRTVLESNKTEDCSDTYSYSYRYEYEEWGYEYATEEFEYAHSSSETTTSEAVEEIHRSPPEFDEENVSLPQRKRHHKKPGNRRAVDTNAEETQYDKINAPEPCTYVSKPRVQSMLLNGERLTAIIRQDSYQWYYYYDENNTEPLISDYSILTIRVYDVSDGAVPTDGSPLKEVGSKELSGDYFTSRSVNDTTVIVTSTYINSWSLTYKIQRYESMYCGLSTEDYIKKAAETVAERDFDELAKEVVEGLNLDGDCSNVFQVAMMQEAKNSSTIGNSTMPDLSGGNLLNQFVSVVTFDMADDFGEDMIIPTKSSGTFNPGNAYLSSLHMSEDFIGVVNQGYSYDYTTDESHSSTYILGFDTTTGVALPFCVGSVPGSIPNEYGIDIYNNHVRIATSEWHWNRYNETTTNKIFILNIPKEDDPLMEIVGEIEHLGRDGESIYAVRFFQDTAYVATFQQVDPFIIVDLSNVTNPKTAGKLDVSGSLTYLQPVEIDGKAFVLSIGDQWNETYHYWRGSNAKFTLFNVSDPFAPEVASEYLDDNQWSSYSIYDYQSVRWLPESQLLILPNTRYKRGYYDMSFQGFVVFSIGVDEIKPVFNISQNDTNCWYEATIPARSLVFGSNLTTVLGHTVISTDLDSQDKVWELDLDEGLNYTCSYDYSYDYRYTSYGYNYNYNGNNNNYNYTYDYDHLEAKPLVTEAIPVLVEENHDDWLGGDDDVTVASDDTQR